ncbi:hypothetical protein HanXRQr2_Chr05g0222731 [Helianthus annuus]|uniref:Uncharacterized protein n=1 Tax=Helianthus annuus TaxID=4232 RepID=A0A251UNU1_HELAN|nr:hypothetical protein HanXRQr2_Chr05g0222731 [Helianthus annuus]KAJ0923366.1 hypothetical protein HanPSC8_Chr05g0215071 [Helianthus annuus]
MEVRHAVTASPYNHRKLAVALRFSIGTKCKTTIAAHLSEVCMTIRSANGVSPVNSV